VTATGTAWMDRMNRTVVSALPMVVRCTLSYTYIYMYINIYIYKYIYIYIYIYIYC